MLYGNRTSWMFSGENAQVSISEDLLNLAGGGGEMVVALFHLDLIFQQYFWKWSKNLCWEISGEVL
jgi:hypothetical protein